jgi:hypothetical protein
LTEGLKTPVKGDLRRALFTDREVTPASPVGTAMVTAMRFYRIEYSGTP